MDSQSSGKLSDNPINKIAVFLSGADRDIVNRLPESDAKPYVRIGIANFFISLLIGFALYEFVIHYSEYGELKAIAGGIISFGIIAVFSRVLCRVLINLRKKASYILGFVIFLSAAANLLVPIFIMYGFTYDKSREKEIAQYRKLVTDSIFYTRKIDSIESTMLQEKLDSGRIEHIKENPAIILELDSTNKQLQGLDESLKAEAKNVILATDLVNTQQKKVNDQTIQKQYFDSQIASLDMQISKLERQIKNNQLQQNYNKEDTLRLELKTLRGKKNSFSDSVSRHEEIRIALNSALKKYKDQLDETNREHERIKQQIVQFKNKASSLQAQLTEYQVLSYAIFQRSNDSLTRLLKSKKESVKVQDSLIVSAAQLVPPEMDRDEKVDHYILLAFGSISGVAIFVLICAIMIFLWFIIFRNIKKGENSFYYELLAEKEKLNKVSLEKEREKISLDYKLQTNIRQSKTLAKELSETDLAFDTAVTDFLKDAEDEGSPKSLKAAAEFEQRRGNYDRALEYIDRSIELDPNIPESWLVKTTLFGKMGRVKEEEMSRQRYAALLSKVNFEKNLQRKITLREIEFKNLPFYGSFIWEFRSNMNILLGKNGYGKSHLMSIMLAQLQEEAITLTELSRIAASPKTSPTFVRIRMQYDESEAGAEIEQAKARILELQKKRAEKTEQQKEDEISAEINKLNDTIEHLRGRSLFDKSGTIKSILGKIPVLAIPDSRFVNKSSNYTQSVIEDEAKKILEFGAYHFIKQAPYEQVIQNFLNTLAIIYFERLTFDDEVFRLINRVFKKLTGNEFRWQEIKRAQDGSGYEIKVLSEGATEALPIQKVSQGTLSVLSMIGVIFHYLDLRYKNTVGRTELVKQHAIVIIDEIDAHLHPSWQQKIIGILRSEFPNIQFIISAHSPLIVAGCREGEVGVMRKTPDGFAIESIQSHLIGMPIADLFQLIFEIEEKDETYLQLAALMPFKGMILKEIEMLKNKTSLNEKEKARLEELEQQAANFSYFESYNAIKSSRMEKEELKRKYEELKIEYDKLTNEMSRQKENPKV